MPDSCEPLTALREDLARSTSQSPYPVDARSLSEIASEIEDFISSQGTSGEYDFEPLSQYEECVFLKNADGVVVYSNEAHRRRFTPKTSPIGRTSNAYLDPMLAARGAKLESLLIDGCRFVECEHAGPCPDGSVYRIFAHKRSLKSLNAPGLAILGVLRLEKQADDESANQHMDLASASVRFRELSERDQQMCRLTALGVSSRELGERLGMTTRGIELRKQKAFAKLGVAKAVDLARLLTRLQDRGYLDLGL